MHQDLVTSKKGKGLPEKELVATAAREQEIGAGGRRDKQVPLSS